MEEAHTSFAGGPARTSRLSLRSMEPARRERRTSVVALDARVLFTPARRGKRPKDIILIDTLYCWARCWSKWLTEIACAVFNSSQMRSSTGAIPYSDTSECLGRLSQERAAIRCTTGRSTTATFLTLPHYIFFCKNLFLWCSASNLGIETLCVQRALTTVASGEPGCARPFKKGAAAAASPEGAAFVRTARAQATSTLSWTGQDGLRGGQVCEFDRQVLKGAVRRRKYILQARMRGQAGANGWPSRNQNAGGAGRLLSRQKPE